MNKLKMKGRKEKDIEDRKYYKVIYTLISE